MKRGKTVRVQGQVLGDIAKTLEIALDAMEGDEFAVRVYKFIELTPEEVIKKQIERLRNLAGGIEIERED